MQMALSQATAQFALLLVHLGSLWFTGSSKKMTKKVWSKPKSAENFSDSMESILGQVKYLV